MSNDLVKRLRDCPDMDAVDEAADALETQAARTAELEAALGGLTAWVAEWTDHVGDCSHKNETCTCGRAFNLHEARAALEGGGWEKR